MSYNLNYIRKVFSQELPEYLDLNLLFNVAYSLDNSRIKLYVLATEKSFLYKCSQDGRISRQYDAAKTKINIERLDNFLGCRLDYRDLVIDTVEENIYYLYCEESGFEQTVRLLEKLQAVYRINSADFFEAVSYLNDRKIVSYSDLYDHRAVSMVKISLCDQNFKIYARPFQTGNNFNLPPNARDFLSGIYDCNKDALPGYISNLWIAYNFGNGQTVISTQNDQLKLEF